MRINHNIAAFNTYRMLNSNNINASKSLEKLSSGLRINRAGDDAAGLAISEKMRAQIRGLSMASKNSQDAISLIQTAEGALNETQSILQRMRELAVQASSDTNVTVDRDQIQKEMNQLTSEINRIGNTTEFNTMKLLNGEVSAAKVTGSDTGVQSAVLTVYSTKYVSGTATMANAIKSVAINTSGDFGSAISAGSTASSMDTYIQVDKSSTGLTVTLKDVGTGGGTFSATDTIVANSDGDYVYNDHGVSFTISAADYASVSNGATMKAGISAGLTSKDVSNSWNTNNASALATISNGITIVSNDQNADVRSMTLSVASASVTVTLADSAGTTIFVDDFTITSFGAFNYDAHGVSFVMSSTAGSTASAAFTISTATVSTTTDASLMFQVGANENQTIALGITDMRAVALGVTVSASATNFQSSKGVTNGTNNTAAEFALSVSSNATAANAVTVINDAINTVSNERSKLGAVQNRLEHTINNLDTAAENLQSSESRIRDVDMAKEMMEFTKNNILLQAGQAMLAQANQQPQGVLQLLR